MRVERLLAGERGAPETAWYLVDTLGSICSGPFATEEAARRELEARTGDRREITQADRDRARLRPLTPEEARRVDARGAEAARRQQEENARRQASRHASL